MVVPLGRNEAFFRQCNRWISPGLRSRRVKQVLGLLEVSTAQFDSIIHSASLIWTSHRKAWQNTRQGARDWTFSDSQARDALDSARKQLKQKFFHIFGKVCRGEEEKKFLQETAPKALFYCIHYNRFKCRKTVQGFLVGAEPTRRVTGRQNPRGNVQAASTSRHEVKQAEALVKKVVLHVKKKITGELEDDVRMEEEPKVNSGVPEVSKSDTMIEAKPDTSPVEKPLLKKNTMVDLTVEQATLVKQEDDMSSGVAATILQPTTPKVASLENPPFVEVFSAKTNSRLFRLKLKHLAEESVSGTPKPMVSLQKLEEQVQQWPFIKWPERMVFIYVSADDYSNITIFNQQTLETAFDDWLQNRDGKAIDSCFRLYATDHDGAPPLITKS